MEAVYFLNMHLIVFKFWEYEVEILKDKLQDCESIIFINEVNKLKSN